MLGRVGGDKTVWRRWRRLRKKRDHRLPPRPRAPFKVLGERRAGRDHPELAAGGIMASRNPPPQGEQPGPEVSGTRPTALDLAPVVLLPSPPPVFVGLGRSTAPLSNPRSEPDVSFPSLRNSLCSPTSTKAEACPAPTSSPSPSCYSRGFGGLIGW